MTKVFLSYYNKDREIVLYVAAELRARGADVFIDELSLRPGVYIQQLAEEIHKREYFLVFLTPKATKSKWVLAEIALAVAEKPEKIIIPLLVKPLSQNNWRNIFILKIFQYIDFTKWFDDNREELAINKLVDFMNLPLTPTIEEKPFLEKEEWDGAHEEEEEDPWLSLDEIIHLLKVAQSLGKSDPDRSTFLYNRALTSITDYVQREIDNLKSK